jgi:hypothetical protein
MFKEKDSDKSTIRFLSAFEKAVQAPEAIEPRKGTFHFPALTAVPFVFAFVSGLHSGLKLALLPIRGQRNDAALTQGLAQGIAIVAFIKAEAGGAATPFANFDAIDGLKDLNLVMTIGFTQRAVQGIAVGIDDQVAFEARNPVFSGVSYLAFRPLFDLITLAS